MNLRVRIDRLESSKGHMMTASECQAAIDRYSAAYDDAGGAYPNATTPADLGLAITTTRSPFQQRLTACSLPGDDDI